jgi:hypothetical protein
MLNEKQAPHADAPQPWRNLKCITHQVVGCEFCHAHQELARNNPPQTGNAAASRPAPAPGRDELITEALERAVDMKVHGAPNEFWDEWEQHARAALTAPVPTIWECPNCHAKDASTDAENSHTCKPKEWL